MSEPKFNASSSFDQESGYDDVSQSLKQSPCIPIANAILKRNYYFTYRDTEEIFAYVPKGTYNPYGDTYIKQVTAKIMGKSYRSVMANEVINYIKTQTYKDRSQVGTPSNKLTLLNGVLDISNRNLLPHNPKDLSLTCLPVAYDSKVRCPRFLRFLAQIMTSQETETLQEYIGYCLQRGYTYKKALLLVGPTNTGKTTLLRVVIMFLGKENTSSISLHNLDVRFLVAPLFGKMANICDELSAADLRKTDLFKAITGDSQITAENKHKDPFTFMNEAKQLNAANKTPTAPDSFDDAFFTRWLIIKMLNQFNGDKADPHLLSKLTTKSELSGILNWALDGLDRLNKRGRFIDLPSLDEVKAEFGCGDSVTLFVKDMTKRDPSATISKKLLYNAYTSYCGSKGLGAEGFQEFCKRIGQLQGVSPARLGGRPRVESFRGIRL